MSYDGVVRPYGMHVTVPRALQLAQLLSERTMYDSNLTTRIHFYPSVGAIRLLSLRVQRQYSRLVEVARSADYSLQFRSSRLLPTFLT